MCCHLTLPSNAPRAIVLKTGLTCERNCGIASAMSALLASDANSPALFAARRPPSSSESGLALTILRNLISSLTADIFGFPPGRHRPDGSAYGYPRRSRHLHARVYSRHLGLACAGHRLCRTEGRAGGERGYLYHLRLRHRRDDPR